MNKQPDFESIVQERLDELKAVPGRNPQAAARTRARFLAQARAASEAHHHKGWGFIFRKQQFAMNMVVTILVIAGLLVGGGTTVKAAQDDLPNEPLYGIKTLSEDVSLQFENDPEAKVDRLLELAQTRVEEMSRLIESGQTPPEQVRLRLEQHLQQTLQICSNMEDATLAQTLPQVREQLRKQESELQRVQNRAAQGAQPVLQHTRAMLQAQLHVVDEGLVDHAQFRSAVDNGFLYEQTQTPPSVAVPSKPSTPSGKQNGQATPQPGSQGNGEELHPKPESGGPRPHVTPTPKNNNSSTNPGNNSGENNKNKDKGKDQDPKDKDPEKGGSGGNGTENGNGNGSGKDK